MKQFFIILLLAFAGTVTQAQTYPEMVQVEGGTIEMGYEYFIYNTDESVNTVTLKTFSIAKTETTVLQWKTYIQETGHKMPEEPSWGWNDNDPIVNLTWDDAENYCKWLSDKTGKLYRLPTEAEWQYAALGGNKSKGYTYSGSNDIDEVAWYEDNAEKRVHNVAQKRANELGLYDMSGNALEMCERFLITLLADPLGENQTDSPDLLQCRCILRGGSWLCSAPYCGIAFRDFTDSSDLYGGNGFRVVLSQ